MSQRQWSLVVRSCAVVRQDDAVMTLQELSQASGCPPELALRLVDLGVLEAVREGREPLFSASALLRTRRALRLKDDFALNVDALALVMELLDRIEDLEARLRRRGL
ncbi:MAG TPA: chaperone modulator CbpM [Verrucomicrobiae bacterium]|nr:chaperone modulator CbpM [Verrucomicrobiae bacterium]